MSQAMAATASADAVGGAARRVRVVLFKELRDHLRDRRSLLLALIYPVFGPLLLGMLLNLTAGAGPPSGSGVPVLGLIGGENAPGLIRFLADREISLVEVRGDPVLAIRSGHLPLILAIPTSARSDRHFSVRLLADPNRIAGATGAATVADLISDYSHETGRQMLVERGIDPTLVDPITVERINVGRRPSVALFIYGIIPPLIVFMIFLGAVYIAIDTTVGERERSSWEPLLTAPVRAWELLLGKAGAAFAFTAAAVGVNLVTFRIVLGLVAAANEGMPPPPSTAALATILLLALPLIAFAVVLQLAIAAISRSMKEAQIYLGLLPLVPALPGMVAAFSPVEPSTMATLAPVFGEMLLFTRLVGGDPIDLPAAAICTLATLTLAALVFRAAVSLFRR